MKVLVVINFLGTGGAERLLVSTLPKMKKEGMDLSLLVLNNSLSHHSYVQAISRADIPIIDLNATNIYNPLIILKINKILNRDKYDAVHVHLFPSSYWVSLAHRFTKNAPKLFFTEHSTDNKRRHKSYLRPIEKFIYSRFTKVVAITKEVQANLVKWLGRSYENKLIHIPNGVDFTEIESIQPYDTALLREHLKLPQNATLMLMAASFRYPKRQDLLIEALNDLPEQYYLLLAGDGDGKYACEKLVSELNLQDRVRFLGFRDDIGKLMKSVKYNILYSDYEGMSGVALESMAASKMFIGSNVNGIKDIVPNDNFLFSSKQDLVAKIKDYDLDILNYQKVVESGVLYAKRFDITKMILMYRELYYSN